MKKIIVCGDSHARVFKLMNNKQKTSILMYAKLVEPAQGMVNPKSKTNAYPFSL